MWPRLLLALPLPVHPRLGANEYTWQAARAPARADLAWRLKLGGKALEILLASERGAFGDQGMEKELNLLLQTGRIKEAREWLSPQDEEALGSFKYHGLQCLFGAALDIGRRAGAEAVLVDKFSNCSWVRRVVDELPAHAYHVRDAVLPFGMEPIRSLSHDLLGPGPRVCED